jgi:hypothetical protein
MKVPNIYATEILVFLVWSRHKGGAQVTIESVLLISCSVLCGSGGAYQHNRIQVPLYQWSRSTCFIQVSLYIYIVLEILSLFVDWSEICVLIFYHFQVGFSFELVVDFGHCSQITLIYWGGRSLQSQMKVNQTWEFDIKNDVQCGATQRWGIVSF